MIRWLSLAALLLHSTAAHAVSRERGTGNMKRDKPTLLEEMMRDSPGGLYLCDEPSGAVATDVSGNGRDAVWAGGISYSKTPLGSGSAASVQLDGVRGTGLQVPRTAIAADSPVTVEAWFYPTTVTAAQRGWFWTNTSSGIGIIYDGAGSAGNVRLYNGSEQDTSYTVSANTRYHIVLVINGNSGSMFVDGAFASEKHPGPWDIYDGTAAATGINMGGSYTPLSTETGLVGQLDTVAIYQSALLGDRIAKHFAAAF